MHISFSKSWPSSSDVGAWGFVCDTSHLDIFGCSLRMIKMVFMHNSCNDIIMNNNMTMNTLTLLPFSWHAQGRQETPACDICSCSCHMWGHTAHHSWWHHRLRQGRHTSHRAQRSLQNHDLQTIQQSRQTHKPWQSSWRLFLSWKMMTYQWKFIIKYLLGPLPLPVVQLFFRVSKQASLSPRTVTGFVPTQLYLANS